MATRVGRSALVGREAELAAVCSALEARAERPGVLLGGEAGIGKTRLLREFASRVTALGGLVTWGGCLESGAEGLPFAPFVEALGRLYEQLGNEPDILRGPGRAELAALIPDLGPQPSTALERIRLYEAVRALLDRVPDPTVLILEDIHWADRSSLELLSYLVRRLRHGCTLVVASFRSDEVLGGHPAVPVLAELGRTQRALRIDLPPLESAEIARLVRAAQPDMPADVLARIIERSEGNPFFAEVLAGASRDESLPATLRDLLLLRLGALGQSARRAVDLVAVAGRPASIALLEAAWEGPADGLDRGLAEADERGLLVHGDETSRIALRHELVGEAVEAGMPPRERARLHERLATILTAREELGAPTLAERWAELARHWRGAGRDAEALQASLEAAMAAERLPARAEAWTHYQRALKLWSRLGDRRPPLPVDHAGLIERAANAAVMAGDAEAAVALQHQSIEETDRGAASLLASRYSVLARWHDEAGQREEAIAAAEQAIGLVPADPPGPERASALFTIAGARMRAARYRDAVTLAREAAEMAAKLGLASVEACARAVLGLSLWCVGDEVSAMAELRRALPLAERSADSYALDVAHSNLCWVLAVRAGDAAAAEGALRAHRAFAERYDTMKAASPALHYYEAAALFAAGRWDECLEEVEPGLSSSPEPVLSDDLRAIRGRIRVARGLVSEGEAELRAAISLNGRYYDAGRNGYLGLTEAALAQRQPERALDIIEEAFSCIGEEDLGAVGHLHVLGTRAAADLAEAATARRDVRTLELAESAGDRHRTAFGDLPSRFAVPRTTGNSTIMRLSAWGEAEAARLDGRSDPGRWAAASQALDGWIVPHEVPSALYREAEAFLGRGERAKAGDVLREAHRRASDLGLAPLLDEITSLARRGRLELLAQAREERRGTEAADRYGLSAREREVLALLIEGRTNREIGETLFISEKTASVHVSHILDKLAVNSRGAAAALAARAELISGRRPR
jgi:DNA-binding CsgD family transcriptional regulator